MADYSSEVKITEENTDGGLYDHEFIIKEEEEEETELGRGEEIKCEGDEFLCWLVQFFILIDFHLNRLYMTS